MKPPRQPPPLPKTLGQPPVAKRPRLGCFTKFGLIVIAILLLVYLKLYLKPYFQSAAGRRELLAKTITLFSSPETYIFGGVLLPNVLLYSLMMRYLYPTGADTRRGIGRAIMLLMRDREGFGSDPAEGELKHFFLIFVLPILFYGAGTVEYQYLKEWLLGP